MRARRAAWALLVIAACHGQRPRSSAEVRIHLEAEPAHLNPLLAGDALGVQVALGDVLEPLYEADPETGELRPALATAWTRDGGDTEWTFTLRRGVVWHDGAPFAAADVAFTFELLRGGAPSVLAADFDDLVAIEAPDPHTVRLRFAGFRLGRDQTLALVPILPRHLLADAPAAALAAHPTSRAPVGTGPYRFDGWTPGREIRLRRFDGWWGQRPAIERVVYRVIRDRTQAVAQLEAGELDVIARAPTGPTLDRLVATGRFAAVSYDAPYFLAARWNCRGGPLADVAVRRALAMTLDRETIVREIFRGRARAASGPWEPDDPAYDPAVAPWPFDPEAARELIGGRPLRVTMLVPQGSSTLERIATIWREDAKRAGVDLVIQPDGAVIERARRGDFEAFLFGWTTGREQDFYHHLHSSQIGADNYGGFRDEEIDRLLERMRATPEAAARRALAHALHRRLHELQPLTVIAVDGRAAIASARLRDVWPGPWGVPVRRMSVAAP